MTEEEYNEYMLAQKILAGLFIGAAGSVSLYGLYVIGKAIYWCFAKTSEARVAPLAPQNEIVVPISSDGDGSLSVASSIEIIGEITDNPAIASSEI